MSKSNDEIFLARCLEQIEARLNRGGRSDWTSYDFEQLINEIYASTGVRLSLTTLKRITGRVKYDSFPTHTTLNALAGYLGFKDWRDFTQSEKGSLTNVGKVIEPRDIGGAETGRDESFQDGQEDSLQNDQEDSLRNDPTEHGRHAQTQRSPAGRIIWIAIALPLFFGLYLLVASRGKSPVDKDLFTFSADKVFSKGVPNSVVFHYDASAVPADSVFIVQTWDISRKTLVPRDKHEHSAIYYYPGFFRAKLIVDDKIVKTHDLQIASDGWLCLAEQEPRPVYFSKDDVIGGDSVTVGLDALQKYNLPLHPRPPRIRIYNQGDMGTLMNDNFIFETELKNPFDEGANTCQFVQVLIQCKDDIIIIPLSAKACIGDLFLYACGFGVDSKHGDLSGFGCDLNEWVTLRVETKNKHMNITVNGKAAYEMDFPNEPTGIVGVQYRFYGPASVRNTKFEGGGDVFALKAQ